MPQGHRDKAQIMNMIKHRWPKRTMEERFWQKVTVKSPNECWPWKAGVDDKGYGRLNGLNNQALAAHRLALVFVGKIIPPGMLVCHKCDNPPCCNPNHLYVGSSADNMRDMKERGRQRSLRGDEVKTCQLNAKQVLQIRERLKNGEKPIALGREYGVSNGVIWKIRHRHTWKHI